MQSIDWIVLSLTLAFIVIYGAWKTKGSKNVEEYIKGGNDSKWWTIGLSVMATQASAITFLSTPGQAFHSGMGFVQFYFGLPIAMVIICLVFIPIYHKLKVYTAYEFLEGRFDKKTRTLTAILFLIQRGLAAGITIFAPAIILSAVLGWDLITLNVIIGLLVIIYTVSGGTKAVSVTQKQQMGVIFAGMFIAFYIILDYLPDGITFTKALEIAGASDKMKVLDFSWDLNNRYTVWTGILGGTFLMLSYFGTDQSQVQRYLSGKSVRESQLGLIFNGLLKVPMQFFILLVGVMVFVFYQFNSSPLNFNEKSINKLLESKYSKEYRDIENRNKLLFLEKKKLSERMIVSSDLELKKKLSVLNLKQESYRLQTQFLIRKLVDSAYAFKYEKLSKKVNRNEYKSKVEHDLLTNELKDLYKDAAKHKETNDKDYVFIQFILNNLPKGLIGLLLAVILSAAMSSTASELNALASTTAMDLYKRNVTKEYSDAHYVKMSKWFTLGWGILAIIVACVANLFDNLIQLVNIIGSIFYGNVLGVFLLAFFIKAVKGNAVFIAAIITQILIVTVWYLDWLPYLWLNALGCGLVMLIAVLIQILDKNIFINDND
ncbi:sodium:solute symporter [Tenacibaculum sp. E3R01]|uniref:sodium:solute symporter n=1 Tax=Tenacibaculum sp. E3R01 TaxID=2267227 RepID=UPI000DEA74E1|nr:sodium:solute symporter [Tenacibaculum sp. E3R01]RBW55707.1 sodium:solute symporter [Tenacibaculum sp. E3R01]